MRAGRAESSTGCASAMAFPSMSWSIGAASAGITILRVCISRTVASSDFLRQVCRRSTVYFVSESISLPHCWHIQMPLSECERSPGVMVAS